MEEFPTHYKVTWTQQVISEMTQRYFEIGSGLLTSVQQTEESILKLKSSCHNAYTFADHTIQYSGCLGEPLMHIVHYYTLQWTFLTVWEGEGEAYPLWVQPCKP